MASTTFDALYGTIFGTSGGKSQREKRNKLVSFYENQFVERAKRDEAKRDLSHDPTWIKLTTDMAEMNTEYSRHEQALMRLDKDLAAKSKELSEYEKKCGCDAPQPRKLEYDTDTIAKIKRVNDLYKADRDA
jgi:hypothetical protein